MAETAAGHLHTRLGVAVWHDNRFCGRSVLHDLVGQQGGWGALSMAMGGPSLTPAQQALLDELCVCTLSPDPRIWPFKATRLAAAYGGWVAGLCVGYLIGDHSTIGGAAVGRAAALLVQIDEELGEALNEPLGAKDPTWVRLEGIVQQYLARGCRLAGYGVAFRPTDERVVGVARSLERHRCVDPRYWNLARQIEQFIGKHRRRLPMNLAGACAAVLLDLGFSSAQVEPVATLLAHVNYLANAVEGAHQAPAALQRLPASAVRYEGEPPRLSPRAQGRGRTSGSSAIKDPPG